jgi:hypothetical protein
MEARIECFKRIEIIQTAGSGALYLVHVYTQARDDETREHCRLESAHGETDLYELIKREIEG